MNSSPQDLDNQSLLRATWNHVSELVILLSIEKNLLHVNRSALVAFGYPEPEMLNRNFESLFGSVEASEACWQQVLESEFEFQPEVVFTRKNGDSFIGKFNLQPIVDEVGQINAFLLLITDITARKQADEIALKQQKLLERMGQMAKVGYWNVDLHDETFEWSGAIREMADKDLSSVIKSNAYLYEQFHEDDRELIRSRIVELRENGGHFVQECRIVRPSGEIRYLSLEGEAIEDIATGEIQTIFGILVDITEQKAKEKELVASSQLLHAVINAIPFRVFWKDRDCRYWGCNKLFLEDARLDSPDQLIGKTDFETSWKINAVDYRADDMQVMKSGIPKVDYEESQDRCDGTKDWLRTSKSPIRNKDGKVIGVLGTYEDISEQREQERLHALTHYSVDQVGTAVVWTRPDGTIFYINQTAAKWLQYTQSELIGKKIAEIDPVCDDELWERHWNEIKVSKMKRFETIQVRKDSSSFPTEIFSNYVEFDGEEFNISFVFDISERRESERKIQAYQDNLELQVEKRTEELKDLNAELMAFAYTVSHDLRTPLGGIDGLSRILLEDYESKLDENGKHFLQRVRSETRRMSSLVDDILKLSRIGRMQVEEVAFDIVPTIESIIDELKALNPERQVAVTCEYCHCKVNADLNMIYTALYCLLENAWKFTSKTKNATIDIRMSGDAESSTIAIHDNGVGFNMDYVDELFKPFQRLHESGEFEGNGIGLATVYSVVKKHKGNVWAESVLGEGACFYLQLMNA